MKALLPPDEDERLKALGRYEILDTDPEREFDEITLLASRLCGTPIAVISLGDKNRQWFKSKVGIIERETSRDLSFCAYGMLQTEGFVIKDARVDERFASNPLVTGHLGIRFYAGTPLVASDGHALGMLCVMDRVPRGLNLEQKEGLQALGRQVVVQLELRRSLIELQQSVARLQRAEEELCWKTAFLEAQVHSSLDGILVIDQQGKKILQNQRTLDLFKIPPLIADDQDDEKQLRWVMGMTKDPRQFMETALRTRSDPDKISRNELELKNGTVLDRYSCPVVGKDGRRYGRIWTFRDITERKRTEESLRLLGSAVEQSKESIVITDTELDAPGPSIVFVNPAFTKMTGYTAEETIGKTPRFLQGPRTDRALLGRLRQNLERGEVFAGEGINYRKDGTEFHLEWQIAPISNASGKATHFVAVQRDITERKRLEAKLLESQQMETVGKLAGGIAHDFNTILTTIIGHAEMIRQTVPSESSEYRSANEIGKAADRAALLTQQLLAFGRKQMLQRETLDLNAAVGRTELRLRGLLGEGIKMRVTLNAIHPWVIADDVQVQQMLVQLAMNAQDAMPSGGKLTLETGNITLDEAHAATHADIVAGEYVMIAMTDTGVGISDEVKPRIFEPFFTTKPQGEGTGLGLSMCYGIARQLGGHLSVYSEPSYGTTFKVLLPRVAAIPSGPVAEPARVSRRTLKRGTETILLVEDDAGLRDLAATVLKRFGYTVHVAANGCEAMRVADRLPRIDLLLTDVVMPQMSGTELATRLRSVQPTLKVLFTSAYTEEAIVHHGILDSGIDFLHKPYSPSVLAEKMRAAFDGEASKNRLR